MKGKGNKLKNKIFLLFLIVFLVLGMTNSLLAQDSSEDSADEIFVYEDNSRRDPFWSLVNSGGGIVSYDSELSVADLFLEGIVADPGGKSLAIINGKIVRMNDNIDKFVVSEIGVDSVILEKDGQSYSLKLKKGGMR